MAPNLGLAGRSPGGSFERTRFGYASPRVGRAESADGIFLASVRVDAALAGRLPCRVTGAVRRRPMAPYPEPVGDDNPSRALVRPVLKHGPRSLTCVRVVGFRAGAPSDVGATADETR